MRSRVPCPARFLGTRALHPGPSPSGRAVSAYVRAYAPGAQRQPLFTQIAGSAPRECACIVSSAGYRSPGAAFRRFESCGTWALHRSTAAQHDGHCERHRMAHWVNESESQRPIRNVSLSQAERVCTYGSSAGTSAKASWCRVRASPQLRRISTGWPDPSAGAGFSASTVGRDRDALQPRPPGGRGSRSRWDQLLLDGGRLASPVAEALRARCSRYQACSGLARIASSTAATAFACGTLPAFSASSMSARASGTSFW